MAKQIDAVNVHYLIELLQTSVDNYQLQYDLLLCMEFMLYKYDQIQDLWSSMAGYECLFKILMSQLGQLFLAQPQGEEKAQAQEEEERRRRRSSATTRGTKTVIKNY